ncbi:MAG: cardiolipin synthase [Bdellovibrionales bacterium]|nr:cardiolipin synthase [Bdellovibrionales bacterium]
MESQWFYIFVIAQVVGFFSSLSAVLKARTSEAAIAWFIALNLLPIITLPFYWFLGRSKIDGYVEARRRDNNVLYTQLKEQMGEYGKSLFVAKRPTALEKLAMMPQTSSNKVELIVEGDQKLAALLELIEQAQNYILLEYYIFEADQTGLRVAEALAQKARLGVKVYVLVDELGTSLSRSITELWDSSGIQWSYFKSARGLKRFYQLNFRNHRKLVIVDGKKALLGGMNIGDNYLIKTKSWRDIHIKINGPSVLAMQVAFLEGWFWIFQQTINLNWDKEELSENEKVIVVPSGPSDELDTARLMILDLILKAKHRLWLTTPYFVPTSDTLHAMILAKLKGVDVRLLVPKTSDNFLVKYASQYYLNILHRAGVDVYEYTEGFYHGKSILVDDQISCVSSVNLDNRSMYLNFEIAAVIESHSFNSKLSDMLEQDFSLSHRYGTKKIGFFEKLLIHLARLLSPVL